MLRFIKFAFIAIPIVFVFSTFHLIQMKPQKHDQIENSIEKEYLVELLSTYKVYSNNQPLELIRLGRENDGGYVVPELALKAADVLLGYGIADDISFEEEFANAYKKPSFGFDCGVKSIKSNSNLFTFIDECIGSESFLYSTQDSSNKISSFNSQVKNLNLENKKIFIKMDIEGAEYIAFEDILKHSKKITGIAMEIHIMNHDTLKKAINLLSNMTQDFILVHIHGNNCSPYYFTSKSSNGELPNILELSFINKSLIDNYHVLENQKHPTELDMPNNSRKKDIAFEIVNKKLTLN